MRHELRLLWGLSVVVGVFAAVPARADETADAVVADEAPTATHDARNQVPILAYAYSAGGVDGPSFGAQGHGAMIAGEKQAASAGGGVTVFGSPIDRLTLIGDLPRDAASGHFAPSVTVIGRPYGENARGFAFGLLGKYKVEGFGVEAETTGPEGEDEFEFEHEIEGGLLVGYAGDGWHVDLDAITGVGVKEGGEVDVEGRVRVGCDLGDYVRLGLDGQVRGRAHGAETLPGGRTWDFAAGPQVLVGVANFFGSFTAGPVTLGVAEGVGFSAMATAGGTTL